MSFCIWFDGKFKAGSSKDYEKALLQDPDSEIVLRLSDVSEAQLHRVKANIENSNLGREIIKRFSNKKP